MDDSATTAPVPPSEPAVPPPVPPQQSLREPGFKGKGLLISAMAVTGLSWVFRSIAVGIVAGADCYTANTCTNLALTAAAFTYLAPTTQFIATGLVIPGGILKGRHDGWGYVTSGKPNRNGKAFLIGGAVTFGVFTALSIAIRPAFYLGCLRGDLQTCASRGALAGYFIGAQASDTLSTVGAGLMSYGIAYNNYRRTNAPQIGFAPWSNRGAYGMTVSGRF